MSSHLLVRTSSFCLIASVLAWSSHSQAQGVCYYINPEGQVINLDALCEDADDFQGEQSQSENSGATQASGTQTPTQTQAPAQPGGNANAGVRTYTIVGPATSSRSSTRTSTTSGNSTTNSTSVAPRAGSRTTQIDILRTQDSTITVVDSPDRVVNGVVIEGRDRVIVSPPTLNDVPQPVPINPPNSTTGTSSTTPTTSTVEGSPN